LDLLPRPGLDPDPRTQVSTATALLYDFYTQKGRALAHLLDVSHWRTNPDRLIDEIPETRVIDRIPGSTKGPESIRKLLGDARRKRLNTHLKEGLEPSRQKVRQALREVIYPESPLRRRYDEDDFITVLDTVLGPVDDVDVAIFERLMLDAYYELVSVPNRTDAVRLEEVLSLASADYVKAMVAADKLASRTDDSVTLMLPRSGEQVLISRPSGMVLRKALPSADDYRRLHIEEAGGYLLSDGRVVTYHPDDFSLMHLGDGRVKDEFGQTHESVDAFLLAQDGVRVYNDAGEFFGVRDAGERDIRFSDLSDPADIDSEVAIGRPRQMSGLERPDKAIESVELESTFREHMIEQLERLDDSTRTQIVGEWIRRELIGSE